MPSQDIRCPRCSEPYRLHESLIGRKVECTRCSLKFFTAHDDAGYRAAYVDGLHNLLAELEGRPTPPRRVFFTSSTGVYGQDDGSWVNEGSPTEPGRFSGRRMVEAEGVLAASSIPHTSVRLGGIYAEGVDYPGSMLSQVIVVSPGLPPFNMERDLLKNYYQEHYGHGFSYAYLIPGLTRVVQAAGRLLRSETDRGVITLICRRFQDGRYARYLPGEWVGESPKSMLYDDPTGEVERFFE